MNEEGAMKTKKLLSTMIFLAVTLAAYIIASVLFCYTTKPAVEKGEFPFSITYEYKGEQKTLSGVFECEFSHCYTIHGEHHRHWNGEAKYENQASHFIEQNDELQTSLALQHNMYAGYFMGDPLHQDHYEEYGLDQIEPDVEYYDYANDVSLTDENKEEILSSIGFKIIDFTYADPIENSFSFSGICFEADNVIIFVAISLVFFLLCLIFVRKDPDYQYVGLDKLGLVFNFLMGIFAVPFITIVCILFGLVESRVELINQITYNIPPIAILCLALSVAFRRKGYSKTGFSIQFGAIPLFMLILIFDMI